MERWHFDLDQIRRNWEQGSKVTEKIAPTAAAEKFCPGCGAELPVDGSSAGKIAPTATVTGSAPTATGSAPTAMGSALLMGADSPRAALPSRFAGIQAPRDPYPDAQAMLARVRSLAHRQLAAHEPTFAPFLKQAEEALQGLAAKPGEGGSTTTGEGGPTTTGETPAQPVTATPAHPEPPKPPPEPPKPVDRKKLRADLDKALGDLEAMVAMWSGIGR